MTDRGARPRPRCRHAPAFGARLLFALVPILPGLAWAQATPAAPTRPPTGASQDADAAPVAATLDTVQVIGQRRPLSTFPGAVSVIDAATLQRGQRQVSVAESLGRVPGISVLDRQNHAQDLQLQSRGFGARSTFGIRGIKLVVDGIPASAADGQGQAATFAPGALDRIEVLRGPLALQYGNAAGGAIIGYTDLESPAGTAMDAWGDDAGAHRVATRWDGAAQDWRWRLQGSHFATGGPRPHSAAERSQLVAVAQWSPRDGDRVRLAFHQLEQPDTQDPLGLTAEQLARDPRGTDPAATQFDARKRIANRQLGVRWERERDTGASWLGGYGIERDVVQYLSLPVGAQVPASSAGGVIDLGRRSRGMDAGHRWSGRLGSLALGVELARLDEARRGYENFVGERLGVPGRLRRDERNRLDSREAYVLADARPAPGWSVLGGLRHSRLAFRSQDRYVAPGNGDDSGRLAYAESAASLGVARAWARGEVFASLGRGFETPTITELAYRPDGGAGFNTALRPAHLLTGEVGARWHPTRSHRGSVAVYRVRGSNEIVPATSRGGRASFANAAQTRRDGIELGMEGDWGRHWTYALAASAIRARFTRGFAYQVASGSSVATREVAPANRIPGIPRADAFAELAWHAPDDAVSAAVELRASDRIAVDDRNTAASAGYARLALRLDWRMRGSGWNGFVRLDNMLDHDHVGSVIVNEGNARYFEPAAGRALTIGLGWTSRR